MPQLGGSYRGVVCELNENHALRSLLGLRAVPDHSTLARFTERIDADLVQDIRKRTTRLVLRMIKWRQRGGLCVRNRQLA